MTMAEVRQFASGATRDTDEGKLDYEAFNSPLVSLRYAQFMHHNRRQKDGTLRAGDNWQRGISRTAYVKSLCRHVMDVRLHMRNCGHLAQEDLQTALCAVIFNAKGLLYEVLVGRDVEEASHQ